MGSIANELINALYVAQALNLTVLLRETDQSVVPLRIAFNIPKLRHLQVTSEFASTFVWDRELLHKTGRHPDEAMCTRVNGATRSNPSQTIQDMATEVVNANPLLQTDAWKNNPQRCIVLPILDGSFGFMPENNGCEQFPACRSLFHSFVLKANVIKEAERLKRKIQEKSGRGGYTCLHVNSYWCGNQIGQASDTVADTQPANFGDCLKQWTGSAFCDERAVAEVNRVFLVGQDDAKIAPALRKVLLNIGKNSTASDRVFTLADLGDISALGGQELSSVKQPGSIWGYNPCYVHRGAVSRALCSPGFADSYIGESFSGFTSALLAHRWYAGRASEMIHQNSDEWSALIYNPQGRLTAGKLPGHEGPATFSELPEHFVKGFMHGNHGRTASWLHATSSEACYSSP